MYRQNQYLRVKPPQQPQVQDQTAQNLPPGDNVPAWDRLKNYWRAFSGGLQNPNISYEQWNLWNPSPQEWLAQHPGKTIQDYRNWYMKYKMQRPNNWLNRARR